MIYTAENTFDDIHGKYVADLGCGCGMLSIAAALLGAETVYSIDIDQDALKICRRNLIDLGFIGNDSGSESNDSNSQNSDNDCASNEDIHNYNFESGVDDIYSAESDLNDSSTSDDFKEPYDLVKLFHGDVIDEVLLKETIGSHGNISTVIMNPPFGTKQNAGVDVAFLKAALALKENNPLRAIYSMHKTSTRAYLQRKAEDWDCDFIVIAEMKFDLPAKYAFHKKDNVTVAVDLIRLGVRK
jgi:predicted RNA methylase